MSHKKKVPICELTQNKADDVMSKVGAFLSFKGEIPSWNSTSPEFYYDLFRRKIANQMCVVELEVHIGRYPDVCA